MFNLIRILYGNNSCWNKISVSTSSTCTFLFCHKNCFTCKTKLKVAALQNDKLHNLHESWAESSSYLWLPHNIYSPFDWILVGKLELRSLSTKKSKTTRRIKPETRAIFFGKSFSQSHSLTVKDKQRGVGVLTFCIRSIDDSTGRWKACVSPTRWNL